MTATPPPLVGRERELATLREHLAAALGGRGCLVLIDGEAGIGKTALTEALLRDTADQGALTLVGRCYDLAETPPYGLWVEAFQRLAAGHDRPALPAPLGAGEAATSQAALFARLRDHLAAAANQRPLVLLLEDLHWADPASLDLLRHLARGLAALPALVLATYRADELTRHHPLYQLLPVLVREARAARLVWWLVGSSICSPPRLRQLSSTRDVTRLAPERHAPCPWSPVEVSGLPRRRESAAGGPGAVALC